MLSNLKFAVMQSFCSLGSLETFAATLADDHSWMTQPFAANAQAAAIGMVATKRPKDS
ncbi:MAG: hypothetical protein ACI9HB_003248 [Gammaproteobacteria bacterium]|jgi:hypothetical protein